MDLKRKHPFRVEAIERIEVETFDAAMTLNTVLPEHSDAAQYSMPWSVAAALVDGELGLAQVLPDRLSDPTITALCRRVEMRVAPDIERRFPAECLGRVTITLKDGRRLASPTIGARGDPADPLTDGDLRAKFEALAGTALETASASRLRDVLDTLEDRPARDLLRLLALPREPVTKPRPDRATATPRRELPR
jgi:2-methylcitrate dehydratase PrpD